MVRELLKHYDDYKIELALCKSFHQEMSCELINISKAIDCLHKCIGLLDHVEADIISMLFFEHASIKTVGDKYGYTKSGMQYKRDKIIQKLSDIYEKASKYL